MYCDDDNVDECEDDNGHLQKNFPKDVREEFLVGRMTVRCDEVGHTIKTSAYIPPPVRTVHVDDDDDDDCDDDDGQLQKNLPKDFRKEFLVGGMTSVVTLRRAWSTFHRQQTCLNSSPCMFRPWCWWQLWWLCWWLWSSSKEFHKRRPKKRSSLGGSSSVLRPWRGLQEPFWGIKLSPALQQTISMVGQCAHGFGSLILIDFDLLKMRIRPPVPEWWHIEIWRIWERNTESVREKYISTIRWQIQSKVVRNAIQRTNAVMLVWTEIPRRLQIEVQMQA